MDDPEYLKKRELAQLVGVSPSTIDRDRKKGLPFCLHGTRVRFVKAEALSWYEGDRPEIDSAALEIIRKRLHCWTKRKPYDNAESKGGGELAKHKSTCFNYGFGRVYVRTYKSGRSSWTIAYYNEDGKRIQKVVPHAQTKEEAALALQHEVQNAFDRKFGIQQKRGKIVFAAFSKVYLQDYAMIAKKSWKTDAERLKILNEFFDGTELREITPLMIQRFRAWRLREGNTKSTCNRYLALLKRMFTIAIGEGYAEENPVKKVEFFSEKDNLKERILSEAEEGKLMETCSEALRPILVVALNSGMRKAEILNLKWNQVDLKARRIKVEKTKGGKVRFIPINDDLLRTLFEQKSKNSYVFFNPETMQAYVDMKKGFKAACRRAKIEGLRFHDLRHTFASRLIEKGADIETVRDLLGHSSIAITQRYIHSTDDRKRAAVELLGGSVRDKVCDVTVTRETSSKLIH